MVKDFVDTPIKESALIQPKSSYAMVRPKGNAMDSHRRASTQLIGEVTTKYDSEGGLMGPMTITHDSMPQTSQMLAEEQEVSSELLGNHLATSRLSNNRPKLPPLQEDERSSRNNSRGGRTLTL